MEWLNSKWFWGIMVLLFVVFVINTAITEKRWDDINALFGLCSILKIHIIGLEKEVRDLKGRIK